MQANPRCILFIKCRSIDLSIGEKIIGKPMPLKHQASPSTASRPHSKADSKTPLEFNPPLEGKTYLIQPFYPV